MNFIKEFKKAGEPSNSIPLYLCEQAYNSLKIWRLYDSPEEMQKGIRADIESSNRFEYRATDEAGTVKAMMIIAEHEQLAHTGNKNILFTQYSFSTEQGLLRGGYKWMCQLAKQLSFPLMMVTRQIGPMEITHKIKEVKQ